MIKQLGLQGNNFPASYGMTDTMGHTLFLGFRDEDFVQHLILTKILNKGSS